MLPVETAPLEGLAVRTDLGQGVSHAESGGWIHGLSDPTRATAAACCVRAAPSFSLALRGFPLAQASPHVVSQASGTEYLQPGHLSPHPPYLLSGMEGCDSKHVK